MFCLTKSNKMHDITNIDRRQSKWMMSNTHYRFQMPCVMKYGYGIMMDTSCGGSGASRLTNIEHSQNYISIDRGETFYDHNIRNKEVCEHF